MGSGTATVTATTGPGRTATSHVLTGIQTFVVDIAKNMIFFHLTNDDPSSPMRQYALTNTVTFTATISGGNWTIVCSAS